MEFAQEWSKWCLRWQHWYTWLAQDYAETTSPRRSETGQDYPRLSKVLTSCGASPMHRDHEATCRWIAVLQSHPNRQLFHPLRCMDLGNSPCEITAVIIQLGAFDLCGNRICDMGGSSCRDTWTGWRRGHRFTGDRCYCHHLYTSISVSVMISVSIRVIKLFIGTPPWDTLRNRCIETTVTQLQSKLIDAGNHQLKYHDWWRTETIAIRDCVGF